MSVNINYAHFGANVKGVYRPIRPRKWKGG